MLDDGKLGTVLAAGAAVFIVFFLLFLLLFGWGFYISSALGAAGAVIVIWWMGVEDAQAVEDEAGRGRVTSRPLLPPDSGSQDDRAGTTSAVEMTPIAAEDAPTDGALEPVAAGADDIVAAEEEEPEAVARAERTGEAVEDADGSGTPGRRPALLSAPKGPPDDLTRLKGVGPKLGRMLNDMGVWHFSQIAAWSEAELDWVDAHLDGFKGRARRDDWVGQAKALT